MKISFFLAVLFFITPAFGGIARLAWDWTNDPAGISFKVFKREVSAVYDYAAPAYTGTNTTCTISGIQGGTNYCFVARAFNATDESPNSNEVCLQRPRIQPPSGFKVSEFTLDIDLANDVMVVNSEFENENGEKIYSTTVQPAILKLPSEG